jgi:putative redox protein
MAHTAKIHWNQQGLSFNGIVDEHQKMSLHLGWTEEGLNDGISPMGLVMSALAGCTGMDVLSIMQKKRQQVSFFEVEVHGEQQAEHPKVYRKVRIIYRFKGENLDPQAIERSIELSTTKYCPVNAMLREVAEIETAYEILN